MKHLLTLSGLMATFAAFPAWAQDALRIDDLEVIGAPVDGKTGFQPAVTRLAPQFIIKCFELLIK